MTELLPADLVNALRCAAAASPDYGATMTEAADEIERDMRVQLGEITQRLQAQLELASAVERLAELRAAIYQACSDMGCFCDEPADGECPMCQLEKKLRLQSDVSLPTTEKS